MPPTRFFESIEHLHRYSLELGHENHQVGCQHCLSTNQWVSHGFVYKKGYGGKRQPVGKRVLCSNRMRRKGCGRTLRLYLTERTPQLHYSIIAVFVFIRSLLSMNIQEAYSRATGCDSPRNAYRWLHKWVANTTHHRLHIAHLASNVQRNHSKRMTLIAETLQGLLGVFGSGKNYQKCTQKPFFAL